MPEVARPVPPPRPPARSTAHAATDPRQKQLDALKALLADKQPHNAGRLTMVDLEPLKARYGGDWEAIVERVDQMARQRIEQRLSSEDVYLRVRPTEYIVVFARLSVEQAQVKCAAIAREIAQALLGEEGAQSLPIDIDIVRLTNSEADDVASLDRAVAAAEQPEKRVRVGVDAFAEPAEQPLAITYEPMWRPGRSVISSYRCRTVLDNAPGDLRHDLRIFQAATEHVGRLVQEGRTLLIVAPVEFECLARYADRREYIRLLANLPAPARRLLVIELSRLPEGAPQSRLQEIVSPLRQHSRAVIAELAGDVRSLTHLQGVGIMAAGVDLAGGETTDEHAVFQRLGRFREAAKRAGLPSYARGVATLSLASATAAAGYDYIAGAAVMAPMEKPKRVVQFGLIELYTPVRAAHAPTATSA